MIVILLIYILSLIFAIVEYQKRDSPYLSSDLYKILYILLTFSIILLCGFKPLGLDRDSIMYQSYFDEFQHITYKEVFFNNPHRVKEVGYILLNKLFVAFGFRSMLIFISVVTIGIKAYLFFKYSKFPFLSNFIYFSFFLVLRDFTQLRDSLAIIFLIVSLISYSHKKYGLSIFCFILALCFHCVALICLQVTLLLRWIPKEKSNYFIIVTGVVLYFIKSLQYVVSLKFLPQQILKYDNYQGGGSFSVIFSGLIVNFLYFYSVKLGLRDKVSTINHPIFFKSRML
ncbi:EpsG family protein [Kaistella carnis]|uniref:EpsG family protein n=1 Tax=Kaistella carnis TaxID=1241979 RepID=UPI00289CB041|nr:EpsG family protein [Kaistella carnis]